MLIYAETMRPLTPSCLVLCALTYTREVHVKFHLDSISRYLEKVVRTDFLIDFAQFYVKHFYIEFRNYQNDNSKFPYGPCL